MSKSNSDVLVGTVGGHYDRYCICIEVMLQSLQMILQCPNKMPSGNGMIKGDDHKLYPTLQSNETIHGMCTV
jgi:NADH dehydrogenase (ubiquinone) Fe-S protein 2